MPSVVEWRSAERQPGLEALSRGLPVDGCARPRQHKQTNDSATQAAVRLRQRSWAKLGKVARTTASSRDDAALAGDRRHVPCALAPIRSISWAAESDLRWSRTRGVVRMRSSRSCPDGRCGVGNHSGARVRTKLHCGQFPAGTASLPFALRHSLLVVAPTNYRCATKFANCHSRSLGIKAAGQNLDHT